MDRNVHPELFESMADPAFYPHAVREISRRETHISVVYLTGDYVYKIKKSVDLGFVDFTTLDKRRFFCEEEVRLNRRLTDDIYLNVIALSCADGIYRMSGPPPAVEYAVQMRQLPASRTMQRLLKDHALGPAELKRLAEKLARFHRKAPVLTDRPVWSYVKDACEENFRQVAPFEKVLPDAHRLSYICQATRETLDRSQGLFERRTAAGRIREGHGDLRTEHVYFTEDGRIQILDCIEFNERLRIVDVASDLAFLAMDLDDHQRPQLTRLLLETYVRESGDAGLLGLLDFYQCYRAMVRCKVNCIQLGNTASGEGTAPYDRLHANACRYLTLAQTYAARMARPVLWIFCGLPGSGKSTLARELGWMLDIDPLNSDSVRKTIFGGMSPHTSSPGPVDKGIYAPGVSRQVYTRLISTARDNLSRGRSIILDATFGSPAYRLEAREVARACGAAIRFVECIAPDAVHRRRLLQREEDGSVSDARWPHFEVLKSRFEPLGEIDSNHHLRIPTTAKVADCLCGLMIEHYLKRRELP